MPNYPVSIVADDREARSGVPQALAAMDGVQVGFRRLPLGDYEVDGCLLFERKTLPDLVASIKDGRLFRQACRLASSRLRSIVIIEGTRADLAANGMSREAIQGALISLTVVLGLPLLRSRNAEESARLMLYAARQVKSITSGAIARKGARAKGKRKIQLQILQALPGVGPARAIRLLERYGSVEAVLQAGTDDLVLLPGIGPATARAIRWVVSEPIAGYAALDDMAL